MISCIILVCMSIVYAQMTPDFAADLADVFWHMTWDLCTNFVMFFLNSHDMGVMRRPNGQVFSICLTDDMGISIGIL